MSYRSTIERIRNEASKLTGNSDAELRELGRILKFRAQSGNSSNELIVPGFALVMEASRRCLAQVHYDTQLYCGIQLIAGKIAEMKTGEGKTLTAALAAFLFAIRGKGTHVVTFNDYLAVRDCEFLRPVYEMAGLTVGSIKAGNSNSIRKSAYDKDITYGSAKEFGFDFLRDRLKTFESANSKNSVMRGLHCALIDEADSVLLDEANTPLVIGRINQNERTVESLCYNWAAVHSIKFIEGVHFNYQLVHNAVRLTSNGIKLIRSLPQNAGTRQTGVRQLYKFIENAIRVRRDFHVDKNYQINDGEIIIIDEFTGRPSLGRQWQKGIHQSVQAKEGLEITPETKSAASITIQSFFRRYEIYCGMTGTAWTARRELKRVYKKSVSRIPTNKQVIRQKLPAKVLKSEERKFNEIARSAKQHIEIGRAVLIGTRSIRQSEALAENLKTLGVDFQLLNARNLEQEAAIIEKAGDPNRVTVATNMAGRGTDIKLAKSVMECGGLHVILAEMHESARIDWQMIGRGCRQGDPGSYQIFVSLDDEILEVGLGADAKKRLKRKYFQASAKKLDSLFPIFGKAQRRTEKRRLTDRLILLRQDGERHKSLFDTGQDPYLDVS